MLLIRCPYCEAERPEIEFRHAGAGDIARPDAERATDEEMAAFLYLRANPRGVIVERWRHAHGCGRYFNAKRDTVSDMFSMTWRAGEKPPEGEGA